MFLRRRPVRLESERIILRLPAHGDFNSWTSLRARSRDFLTPWEPVWAEDHLTRKSFTNRVYWAQRTSRSDAALPLFILSRDGALLGAITLNHIRRGPAQMGVIGYWIGQQHARRGYMREAIDMVVHHAFTTLELSRVEAACLPENTASRGVLEKCGFKYEGVAQSYLQINGRWRNHVLYANLRSDRRGRTEVR
ncbi:GNAT family N-acetyltransferase [Paracoccus tegillarcae]|uniref:30S ribosomal protein S5 alanine N-acetyltransferase n=1 Tax=Paracoccus tegillarcae TaxID=1529068 RepID=A0A2K9EGR4_9RHOB|nr:GNAT family protein [Paracoccus tegillarcae]AUH32517.1 30S ribosomal protein S5 alanine N-acetyltransferase [Paracoccus tegillarcae]